MKTGAEEEIEEQNQSEFNSAVASLIRIDLIKRYITANDIIEKYYAALRGIVRFYKEIRVMMKDDMKEKHDKKRDEALHILFLTKREPLTVEQYVRIMSWEDEVRDFEQEAGLNFPKKADARFSLGK